MKWLDFNLAEARGMFVLLVLLLVGSGIAIYKKYHTDFPVEIVFRESKAELRQYKPAAPVQHKPAEKTLPVLDKSVGRRVDINIASWAELDNLPHIGPVLSRRIIEYREKNGKFEKIEDLLKVNGIGKKTLEKIREYIEVK
jgi:competence ComEA-like helix-hairpin-helix protein